MCCLWQNGSAWPEGSGHISSTSKIVDQANEPIEPNEPNEPEQMKCTCADSESVMSANVSQCQPMSANVSQCQPMSANVSQCQHGSNVVLDFLGLK